MTTKYDIMARRFKALGDSKRIYILELLKDGELCANNLLEKLDMSQSTLSHHMKILVDAEIVDSRKIGTWMHYTISKEGLDFIEQYLVDLKN